VGVMATQPPDPKLQKRTWNCEMDSPGWIAELHWLHRRDN